MFQILLELFSTSIIWPLKAVLPEFKTYEDEVLAALGKAFNVWGLNDHPLIKAADVVALAEEAQHLLRVRVSEWPSLNTLADAYSKLTKADAEPNGPPLGCWSPATAESFFLERFTELTRAQY